MINEFSKKEAPIQGIAGLGGGVASRLLTIASGAITYIDDVFSTFLYDGNGSARSITNGIDLAGEGGMLWIKARNAAQGHYLFDTERGHAKALLPDDNSGEVNLTNGLAAFESDGYSTNAGSSQTINASSNDYVSWTFRKCPGFFDIVTWTGNGVAGRQIAHSLGSTPGMVIVKRTNGSDNWTVQHRSLGGTKSLYLNLNNSQDTSSSEWNNTTFTSTHFTVGTSGKTNANNDTYVAYIFAHNDGSFGEDSDEAVIKCGAYTGSTTVNLGFEPQWILVKRTGSFSGNWGIFDTMRRFAEINSSNNGAVLEANSNSSESESQHGIGPTSTGFVTNGGTYGTSGQNYIYVAIRRPHKPPSAGTEVFDAQEGVVGNGYAGSPELQGLSIGFPSDMTLGIRKNNSTGVISGGFINNSRLTPATGLLTFSGGAEATSGGGFASYGQAQTDIAVGDYGGINDSGFRGFFYNFRRAPGFFDVVAFTGTASATTVNHNLKAIPELVIIKNRETNNFWSVYVSSLSSPRTKILILSGDDQAGTSAAGTYWGNSDFTSTQISVGNFANTNGNNQGMIAYLFATLPGISKVGSYSGTGSNIGVDCGFTSGARFVLIKRTDSAGDWYVWDTARGIVGGNDPYLLLNDAVQEVTNKDYIDPLNSGFTVTSSAIADLNTSGGNYIFLAIA